MGCFKRTSEMEKGNTRRRGLCILLLVLIVWLNNHDFLQPCKQHFETFYYRKPSCAETRYFCRLWRRSSSIRCIWEEVKLPPPNSKIQTLQLERRVLSQWKATTFTGDETQGELSLRICRISLKTWKIDRMKGKPFCHFCADVIPFQDLRPMEKTKKLTTQPPQKQRSD